MKICPLCEQGVINKIIIKVTNEIAYICDECEAIWDNEDIKVNEVLNFNNYMEARKLQPLWNEVTVISKI